MDTTLNVVIVAHQGTNTSEILAVLTDANIALGPLDQNLFPGLSSSIRVHQGFAGEQAKTAQTILTAVSTLLSQNGASSVVVTGHSLGGALALLDTVYLSLHLPTGTRVRGITFGMPRVGNGAFANYVDETRKGDLTHINNKEDPVPILPGKLLGYTNPSGEVHILDSGSWVACPGQDNPSTSCSTGDVPTLIQGKTSDHDGPYDGVTMGNC